MLRCVQPRSMEMRPLFFTMKCAEIISTLIKIRNLHFGTEKDAREWRTTGTEHQTDTILNNLSTNSRQFEFLILIFLVTVSEALRYSRALFLAQKFS